MPRVRRAPIMRAVLLANEAVDFAIALRLIGTALVTLDNDHGRAVLAAAWEVSKRLDSLKQLLARRTK
jgi:hypothetical protein